MERKINTEFEYNNFTYQCLEGSDVRGERCKECCLRDDNGWICRIHTDKDIITCFGPCTANYRTDGKYVFFKKIGLAVRKNMKPFDLQAAKSGKPVCTRDGRKARIICFDRKGDICPIIALIEENGMEVTKSYDENGRANYKNADNYDLMMLPEKKEGG